MKKILITGGSGFLGGYLVKAAAEIFQVYATFLQHKPEFPGVNWVNVDLADPSQVEQTVLDIRPNVVIHNAAITNADLAEDQKRLTEEVNIKASEKLSSLSAKISARILYISTDLVFDGAAPPYAEDARPNPLSFYGWSKWQGELATLAGNTNSVIVRPAIMYGPPAISGASFSEWMRKAWENRQETRLFTDQFRTTIFGGNLAEAVIELAQKDFTGIIHLAGSERIDRYNFGLILADQLNLNKKYLIPAKMSDVPLKGKRPADVSLKIDLAQKILQTKFLNCREGIKAAYRDFISDAPENTTGLSP